MTGQQESAHAVGSIELKKSNGIATVSIANPRKRNALTQSMCIGIADAMSALDRDPEVVVIALKGSGSDFSAGAALQDLEQVLFSASANEGTVDYLSRADEAIGTVRKPTIAVVEGICMGGGWQIASACDMVLASSNARIAITPSKLGILYPRAGVERLVRRVGADRAKYLLFTANEVTPELAERWGLVTELIPASAFAETVEARLGTVAKRSQFSIVNIKKLIDQPAGPNRERTWNAAWQEFQGHDDLAVGRAAFKSGYRPEFLWRVSD
ncbi:crotonase [Arthrobacter sp. MYb211]|uniref:enoyl-CoA hydratase/isomerase family protein n=1 Tax=unclassified Arthrobacter TaxID=235627 RepID=UPI000CFAEF31|nr:MULTISPECIES: enoyl-CoA hydratase/isomerase family protein [unclassified Arthrobacter]PRA12355.1 crotonase [Arthrobacter sp. MYb221]PRC08818.1 crotonase [Arthrobacter sp. MYb211]